MNKLKLTFVFIYSSFTCISAYGETLPEITTFAKEICGEIGQEGDFSKTAIKAKLEGKVDGTLTKLLGISANAGVEGGNESVKYKGLPYDQLSSQISDARTCRKELSQLLIKERKNIAAQNSQSTATQVNHADTGKVGIQGQVDDSTININQ